MNQSIKKLVSIYMKEFKKGVKNYSIINYFDYKYYHCIDIKYRLNDKTCILTIDLNIESDSMLQKILKHLECLKD